jgi:hypothetical protein
MRKKQKLFLCLISGLFFLSSILANYVVAQDNNSRPPSPPPKAINRSLTLEPLTNKPPVDPPKRENQVQVIQEGASVKPPTNPPGDGNLEGVTGKMTEGSIPHIQIKKSSPNMPARSISLKSSIRQKSMKKESIKPQLSPTGNNKNITE